MKRKQSNSDGGSKWWSEMEMEYAELLLALHRGCLLGRVPFTWGLKRKRSAIQDDAPSPSSSQKHHGGGVAVVATSCKAEIQAVVKEEALSPTTPLSFPTPESDEKTKPPSLRKTKTSLKKKREYYLQVIEDLTKTKDSLNQEIENVKRHRNQLKAFNLKLKAKEQELNNGPKSECGNPNLEIGQAVQLNQANASVKSSKSTAENEKQKKQLQLMQMQMQMQMEMEMANQNQNLGTSNNGEGVVQFLNVSGHPTTSLPMVSSSSSSVLGRNCRNVENNKGPLLLPDLNLSIEELTNVDSCQPLDENATNKDLNRAMAAQARQRRLQIFRLKKPMGNNSKSHQFHR